MTERTPADRLEKALAELEARRTAAADAAIEKAPEAERLRLLWVKLNALPQSERRRVLNDAGLHHISAAPEPITPLRGTGYSAPVLPQVVNWNKWRLMARVQLWEAIALSISVEPTSSLGKAVQEGLASPLMLNRRATEFFARLSDAQRALNFDGPIVPRGPLHTGILSSPRCEVWPEEVISFLGAAGYSIPDEMREAFLPEAKRVETKEEREDRCLDACEKAGLPMPRRGLGRMPDGIGKLAEAEGKSRQSFTDDVRAALTRREKLKAQGNCN